MLNTKSILWWVWDEPALTWEWEDCEFHCLEVDNFVEQLWLCHTCVMHAYMLLMFQFRLESTHAHIKYYASVTTLCLLTRVYSVYLRMYACFSTVITYLKEYCDGMYRHAGVNAFCISSNSWQVLKLLDKWTTLGKAKHFDRFDFSTLYTKIHVAHAQLLQKQFKR